MKPLHTSSATLVILALVAASSYAAGVKQRLLPPRLSSDDFIVQLIGDPTLSRAKQNQVAHDAMRYAEGYLDGVVDATLGKSWCAPAQFKAPELDDRVVAAMRKRPRGAMPDSAADVLIEQFTTTFPCQ